MEPNPTTPTERLWTPWRMRYISGQAREAGCIFCNRLTGDDDVGALILHRGRHAFVIMNLFPYNTGHVMIVPNRHAAEPEQLDVETLHEMAELLPMLTRSLRRTFDCAGFNVGLNIGAVAGAGVAEHLHEHVVPRWEGDANFMPILASTMAIPELIPSTYAKIRAEIARELGASTHATGVMLLGDDDAVLLCGGAIPQAQPGEDEPVWQALARVLPAEVTDIEIAGWAGGRRADAASASVPAITMRARLAGDPPSPWGVAPLHDLGLPPADRETMERALSQLAPKANGRP